MRRFTLFLSLLLMGLFVFGQQKEIIDYGSGNTPIDNMSHWKEMAELGVVPFNPFIPFKPATPGSSMVMLPKGLQNSTDVVLLDETGVTQSENSVFIDPNDRDYVLNSNNSEEAGSIYGANYLMTDDGGLSWTGSKQGAGGGDKGDPAACIGLNGRHYIGAISTSRKQVVSYSDDGSSWTKVNVESGSLSWPDLFDKNHLWIDNTESGQEGNVYDAWTRFESGHANDNEIEFSRSTNDGVSWSTPQAISSGVNAGNHNQGVNIQCNNTGWVFAVWAIYDDWTGAYPEDAIGFARSPNGGSSFYSANRIVDDIRGIRSNPNNPTNNATGKNMRVNSFPSMAIDVSGGPNHGHIYVVWANQGVPGTNTGTNVSVYMVKSTNGGVNWSTPSRINTVAEDDHAAFFPWITCDPITGNLYVVFYDDRNFADASGEMETWVAFSEDGGASWEDLAVSDVSFTPTPIPGLASGYFGDYLGIHAYDGKVYPTWTDNRSGRALTYVSPLDFGCAASGGGFEHISQVQFGDIDNSSGSDNYADYTAISTDMPLNATWTATITNGVTTYPSDQCGIWVDWNRDDDFDDPGETMTVSGTPGAGPYTAEIIAPAGTTTGDCKMRVRITYTGVVEPCGATSYGEVEDYTITVVPAAVNEWTGEFNSFWHNDNNWSLGHIPTPTEDVLITTNGYHPTAIDYHDEECNDLTIESGAGINLYDQELEINGSFSIEGNLAVLDNSSVIRAYGPVYWESGSTCDFDYNGVFWAYSYWNFNSGANVQMDNGIVDFTGSGTSWIRSYDADCYFNNVGIYKTGAAKAAVSFVSTQDLNIGGNVYVQPSANFEIQSDYNVNIDGSLYNNGFCDFTLHDNTGAVVMTAGGSSINSNSGMANLVFNNLQIDASNVNLNNDGIIVMGDFSIESGSFATNSNTLELHGNFDNNVGSAGFSAGSGLVDMYGPGAAFSIHGNTNFYNLQINDGDGGNFGFYDDIDVANMLVVFNYAWNYGTLTAEIFDLSDASAKFTTNTNSGYTLVNNLYQGGHIVGNVGTFTANDIAEGGVFGTYSVNSDGIIVLNQDSGSGQYADINADITIDGGEMRIVGGLGISWVAYADDASISMSDGVLDMDGTGINFYNAPNSLTVDITGGIIRTRGGFYVDNANFAPSAGMVELYSANDVYLQNNAGNLFDLWINKSPAKNTAPAKLSKRDINSGMISRDSKAYTVVLSSNIDINGDFLLEGGVFDTDVFDMYVAGNWTNLVSETAFMENTNAVYFDSNVNADINGDEAFYDVIVDKTSGAYFALELMGGTYNMHDLRIIDGTLELNYNTILSVSNDITIESNAGLNCFADTNLNIDLGGDWTNNNTTYDSWVGYYFDTETVTFSGSGDQAVSTAATEENFGNLIISKSSGDFMPNNGIHVLHDFYLYEGLWSDNVNGLTHYFEGDFYVTDGPDAIYSGLTGNTTIFTGTNDQSLYFPFGAGYFNKLIIDKTTYAKSVSENNPGGEIKEANDLLTLPDGKEGSRALTVSLTSDTDIQGSSPELTIEEGILDLNGFQFYTSGTVNVNSGGTIIVDEGAKLRINENQTLSVNNGGAIEVMGAPGNEAFVTRRNSYSPEYFGFLVNSGGTIAADHAIFEFTNNTGLWVKDGATIDPAYSFNNCTFQNGQSTGQSGYLILGCDQSLTLDNVTFVDPGGVDPTHNAVNIWDQGDFTFTNSGGDFDGPMFEYDYFDHIQWDDFIPGLWTGAISSDWFEPQNWSDWNVPDAAIDVIIPAAVTHFPEVAVPGALANNLTIEPGADLTVNNGVLSVSDEINVSGNLSLSNNAELYCYSLNWEAGSSDNISNSTIIIAYGLFIFDGTNASLDNTSTIVFNTDVGGSGIGNYDADFEIGNLEVSYANGDFYLAYDNAFSTKVNGSFSLLNNNTFHLQGHDMEIDGAFTIAAGSVFELNYPSKEMDHQIENDFIRSGGQDPLRSGIVNTYSDILLDGDLYVVDADFFSHGLFETEPGSYIYIDNGNLVCDAPFVSGFKYWRGDLEVLSGSMEMTENHVAYTGTSNISGGVLRFGRTFTATSSGSFLPTGGSVELIGNYGAAYIQVVNGNYFYDLNVNRTSPIVVHASSPLEVQNDLLINSEFDVNDNTVSVSGDVHIYDSGILQLDPGATLQLDASLFIHNNGLLEAIGNDVDAITVSSVSGNYNFIVATGGTLSAEYCNFEEMGNNGIQVYSTGHIDPVHSLHNCSFSNGSAGGSLLTINSADDIVINDAYFPGPSTSSYNISKSLDMGSVTFNNAKGDFAGELYENDAFGRVHWNMNYDLSIILEGAFNGSGMRTDINSLLPLDQPFDVSLPYYGNNNVDWYYNGSEAVGAIPDPTVVDWVLVEFRDASDALSALPSTMIEQQAAFLLSDGTIVGLDGSSNLLVNGKYNEGMFVIVYHRNHLGVMSADPLASMDGIFELDFSSASSTAHGGVSALKDLGGVWGLYSGDGDGSGFINQADVINVFNILAGESGYLAGDNNLDGQVNNQDKNDATVPNASEGSQIPE